MKPFKLEDIDKKEQPFKAPEGYFDDLPLKIQKRIEAKEQKHFGWLIHPNMKLAFSVVTVIVLALFITIFNKDITKATLALMGQEATADELLTDVSQEELLAYIDLWALNEDDILMAFENTNATIEFSGDLELEELEFEGESLDDLMNTYDLTDEYL